jgi:predicted MFS family arabinose efflux permease
MVLLLATSAASLTGFYLLLSVVPLYAATVASPKAGASAAGLSTGMMLVATVAIEQLVPRLLGRFGYRSVMGLGLILLGAPAIAFTAAPSLLGVLAISLFRGAGLGIIVVVGTALVAELVPANRLGEGLGLYGVAVGVPPVLGLPLGVLLAGRVGFSPIFLVAALLPLIVVPLVLGLPSTRGEDSHQHGVLRAMREPGLARPTLIFAAVTFAAGVFVTFLPLAVPSGSRDIGAIALLVQSVAAPIARWLAGRVGDKRGHGQLLIPAVFCAAVGAAATIWAGAPIAVIAGLGLFGAGFGLAQNVTLALMFERVARPAFGRVSALWNLAYDAGMGLGAVSVGFLANRTGYLVAFAATAGVLFVALAPAYRDRSKDNA